MKKILLANALLVIGFIFYCEFCRADASNESYLNRSYILSEGTDYFEFKEISLGTLDYKDQKILKNSESSYYEFAHIRHSKIDESQYLIWNFLPVGMGFSFPKSLQEQVSAEWQINYDPSEPILLSPRFTGKRKAAWSALLGNEFVISYGYHYQTNPAPSFWDLTAKYTLFIIPIEKWRLGAFLEPKKFIKGFLSEPKSEKPYQHENIYSSGLWTEFAFRKNLVLQVEGAVNFLEKYVDVYMAKYSLVSKLGIYF